MNIQSIPSSFDRNGTTGLVTLASVIDDAANPTGRRRTVWLEVPVAGDEPESGANAFAPMGRVGLELRSRRYRRTRATERQLLARALRSGEFPGLDAELM